MAFFSLTFLSDVQHRDSGHLREAACSGSRCHGDKRVVTAAGGNRVKLVLPSLESLFHLALNVVPCHFFCLLLIEAKVNILCDILSVRFLRVRRQDILHVRHRKTAILLACGTQDNIADNVKGHIQGLRLVVPDISHLKSAA